MGGARAAWCSTLRTTFASAPPPLQLHRIIETPQVSDGVAWRPRGVRIVRTLRRYWAVGTPSFDYGRCLPPPYALSRIDDRQTVSTFTHNQLGGVAVQSATTENYRYPRKTPDRYIGDAAGSLSWGGTRRVS